MDADIIGAIKIKDGLFIGDEFASQDLEFVVGNKVTHVINCAGRQVPNHWEPIGVVYLTYYWLDQDNQIIFDAKDQVSNEIFAFIEDAVSKAESVLIHSVRGQSRAFTVMAAYIIRKYRWTLLKTLEFLNSRRPDLEIRSNFLQQLSAYENRLVRAGIGPKTSKWTELGEGIENPIEELILRNTFLNAQMGPIADYHQINPAHLGLKINKLRWLDNDTDDKRRLCTNDPNREPKKQRILPHKLAKTVRPIIKGAIARTAQNVNTTAPDHSSFQNEDKTPVERNHQQKSQQQMADRRQKSPMTSEKTSSITVSSNSVGKKIQQNFGDLTEAESKYMSHENEEKQGHRIYQNYMNDDRGAKNSSYSSQKGSDNLVSSSLQGNFLHMSSTPLIPNSRNMTIKSEISDPSQDKPITNIINNNQINNFYIQNPHISIQNYNQQKQAQKDTNPLSSINYLRVSDPTANLIKKANRDSSSSPQPTTSSMPVKKNIKEVKKPISVSSSGVNSNNGSFKGALPSSNTNSGEGHNSDRYPQLYPSKVLSNTYKSQPQSQPPMNSTLGHNYMNYPPSGNNMNSNSPGGANIKLAINNYTGSVSSTNNTMGSFRSGPVKATSSAINAYRSTNPSQGHQLISTTQFSTVTSNKNPVTVSNAQNSMNKRPTTAPNYRPLSPGIKSKSDSPYTPYNPNTTKKTVVKSVKTNKVRMRSASPGQPLQPTHLQQPHIGMGQRDPRDMGSRDMGLSSGMIGYRGISPNKPKWKF